MVGGWARPINVYCPISILMVFYPRLFAISNLEAYFDQVTYSYSQVSSNGPERRMPILYDVSARYAAQIS